MMLRAVASLAFAIATTSAAAAETANCEAEASRLHAHLDEEAHRARRWNTVWAILFGAAAVGQAALAIGEVNPTGGDFDDDARETLYVGTAKATLALGSKIVMPLRIPVPPRTTDACKDVVVMREALAIAAVREKRSFYLTHLGGTVVNLAGFTILAVRRSFKVGAISFALSYPVGPAGAYSQPRRSWALYREALPTWTIGASADGQGGAQLWLGGQW